MQGRRRILMMAALLCLPPVGYSEAGQSSGKRQAQSRSSSSSDRQSGSASRSGGASRSSGASRSGASQRHAQPRSSGGSRSQGSGTRSRHQAPRSQPASPPTLSGAQRRHPRPGTGSGTRYGYQGSGSSNRYYSYYPGYRYGGYSGRYFYSPYSWYGPGYGLSLGLGSYYGFYPYYGGAGYSYYPPPAPGGYVTSRDPDAGSVRIQVQPRDTEVYVDGHYAGVADDFDGLLQRLTLAPGRHELTLERDGYRTHRVLIYVSPGTTLKVRHDMESGSGAPSLVDLTDGQDGYGDGDEDGEDVVETPAPRSRDDRYARREPVRSEAPGTLKLSVTPADASVYVNGAFQGTGQTAGNLSLAPGAHRVEVVRPGHAPWVREIEVEAGEQRVLVVVLPPR